MNRVVNHPQESQGYCPECAGACWNCSTCNPGRRSVQVVADEQIEELWRDVGGEGGSGS